MEDDYIRPKIFSLADLLKRIEFWRRLGDKVVFTNGCFDILHTGHIHLLSTCRTYGDRVIVGLNSDTSVQRLKGPQRPVNGEIERAVLLAALQSTDAICIFSDPTPEALIHAISPDVLVKGGDWKVDDIVGADYVQSYGGTVKTVDYLQGYSTTRIIETVRK